MHIYLLNTDVDNMIIIGKVMEFIMMRFKNKNLLFFFFFH